MEVEDSDEADVVLDTDEEDDGDGDSEAVSERRRKSRSLCDEVEESFREVVGRGGRGSAAPLRESSSCSESEWV